MTLPIYLQEGPPHDPGWTAWALDLLGFATWAPTEAEVLARLPAKLTEYADWLRSRGQSVLTLGPDVAVVERVSGDEVLFSPDHLAATPHEIDRTIELIGWSRQDLLAVVEGLPDELLDWDPPYKRFPAWADWRTIRQVLRHIALTEVGYYLRWIGYDPAPITHKPPAGWRSLLDATRAETLRFLNILKAAPDRSRVIEARGEAWSVRKVLRRLVWHELLHMKNIRRIIRDFQPSWP